MSDESRLTDRSRHSKGPKGVCTSGLKLPPSSGSHIFENPLRYLVCLDLSPDKKTLSPCWLRVTITVFPALRSRGT